MYSRPLSASTTATFGSRIFPKPKDYHMNPKFSIYHSNGTGRDTYINYDNGGFRKVCPNNYRVLYSTLRSSMKTTNINPKFPIYKSNGYGRDSYIYSSCGGFFRCNSSKNFFQSLREYNIFSNKKKYDYLYYANNFKSPKEILEKNKLARKQRATSARLARPKFW